MKSSWAINAHIHKATVTSFQNTRAKSEDGQFGRLQKIPQN